MRKEELRNDPIRKNIIKSVEYIQNNLNIVILIFSGFFLVVAGLSYYSHFRSVKIGNSSHISGLAQNTFINGDIDNAMVKFERVLYDYPMTNGAAQSIVYILYDALNQENYNVVSKLALQYKSTIDGINDPVIKSNIYKIQGDIARVEGNLDDALSYYYKAENISKGTANHIKYQLDVISVLLGKNNYSEAFNMLDSILDNENIGFNEKNIAEELMGFVKYKMGT